MAAPSHGGLLRIDRFVRRTLLQEVRFRVLRLNRDERPRRLREVESVVDARRSGVGRTKAAEIERVFDELKMLPNSYCVCETWPIFAYGEMTIIGTRKPRAVVIELRRGDVIVQAAPVVPDDDDRRRVPVRALADRVDDAGDTHDGPVSLCGPQPSEPDDRSSSRRESTQETAGSEPFEMSPKMFVSGEETLVCHSGPLRTARDRVERIPQVSAAGRYDRRRVVFPRHALGVEQVAQRRVVQARKRTLVASGLSRFREQRGFGPVRRVAAPGPSVGKSIRLFVAS